MKKICIILIFFLFIFSNQKLKKKKESKNKDIINSIINLFYLFEENKFNMNFQLNKDNINLQYQNNTIIISLTPIISALLKFIIHLNIFHEPQFQFEKNFIDLLDKFITLYDLQNNNNEILNFYFLKAFMDSSKNKNDVSSYRECSEKYYTYDQKNELINRKSTYFLIHINKKNDERKKFYECQKNNECLKCIKDDINCIYEMPIAFPSFKFDSLSYMFALCLPNIKCNCDLIKNYKLLLIKISILLDNIFNLDEENAVEEINIIQLNNTGYNKDITNIKIDDLIKFIPLYIILTIILFMFFGTLPQIFFTSCFKKEKIKKENEKLIKTRTFDKKKFSNFSKNFFLKANWEELFNYQNDSNKINNDSGLSYIRGVRGLSMIFLSFGFLFLCLLNSPVAIYNDVDFEDLLKSILYPIFFCGLRYSPRILLSCSGYILFYKLICFLDEKNDEKIEEKINEYNKKQKNEEYKTKIELDLDNNLNDDFDDNDSENISKKVKKYEDILMRKRNVKDVKYSYLVQFFIYQIHKYIFFILVLLFCLYSLPNFYKIQALFYFYNGDLKGIFLGPMWKVYYNNYIQSITSSYSNLILGFTSTYSFIYNEENSENLLFFFWLFYNEVIFFIITSIIIFIGYKYQLKTDKFFKYIFIIIFFLKLGFLFFNINTSLYYYYYNFGSIFVNPLYNYSYYAIGVYFGTLNYVLQKRINTSDANYQDKPFLINSIPVVNFYQLKGWYMKIFNLLIMIIIIISNFSYYIFNYFDDGKKSSYSIYNSIFEEIVFGKVNKIFLLIDIEFIIFFCHSLFFMCFIDNDNFINAFFTNPFWSILNKLYLTFIILINPIILFILFQSGMRISLNIYNCILYTLISNVSVFILCVISYIFFELPFKRIIKLIYKKSSIHKKI